MTTATTNLLKSDSESTLHSPLAEPQLPQSILRSISEQLPKGYESAPCWFPLSVDGEEFYIRGRQLVTLEEYQRQLSQKLEGSADVSRICNRA